MTEWQIRRIRMHADSIVKAADRLFTLADAAETGICNGVIATQPVKDEIRIAADKLCRLIPLLKDDTA